MIGISGDCRFGWLEPLVCTGGEEVQRRSSPHGANRNDVHHKLPAGLQDQGMNGEIQSFPAAAFVFTVRL